MMDDRPEFKKTEAPKDPDPVFNAPWKVSELEFLNYEADAEGFKALTKAIQALGLISSLIWSTVRDRFLISFQKLKNEKGSAEAKSKLAKTQDFYKKNEKLIEQNVKKGLAEGKYPVKAKNADGSKEIRAILILAAEIYSENSDPHEVTMWA